MWIVRINNYYKKWYSIHYQRLKSYGLDVNSYYKRILNSDAMQINLKGQKFWDTTCWNSRKARTKDSREENGKAYSIKHVDPTFPIQYIEFWISRQPAHSTIEGSVQLFCWYYRVESTGEKHKSHLSPDIYKMDISEFFYVDDMSQTIGAAQPHKLFPSKLLEHNKENGCGVDRLWSGICLHTYSILLVFVMLFKMGKK